MPGALALLAATALALVQVTGGGTPSLAEALAAAQPGDTIRLRYGTHRGPLVVRVPGITIIGSRAAVVDGARRGTVITVAADSVTLQGFVVRGSGRSLDRDEAAVRLDHCSGCVVRGLAVRDPLHGIYLLESHGVTIDDNDILGAPDLIESARGNGIHLFNSTGNRLTRNRVRGTRDGMYFSFAHDNLVAGNEVIETRYGLHYMYSDDNRFERNVFTRNAAGAAVMFSKRIVLRENVFARHVGYRAYGLLLHTGEDILAEGNRFEGNLTALFLDGSLRNTFRNNLIAGNGTGIDLLASAEQNVFTENVFRHNRTSVRKVLGSSENSWSRDGRGNDWGDPAVFDLDRDGIGDRPYRAGDPFLSLAAARPALEIFGGTLAAQALSWAEEAFPVFGLPRVVDSLPLAPRHTGTRKAERMVAR
ncbi:MAG TPA: nitrous oxide reductase family maturation protein NosD [Gemmatimonadales bacterium]|jgi:nitrous oxidase accessory protein|nr:nitrous oxide reductase family maturation protein NosD [Gemmatimonadales bacterium]